MERFAVSSYIPDTHLHLVLLAAAALSLTHMIACQYWPVIIQYTFQLRCSGVNLLFNYTFLLAICFNTFSLTLLKHI